MKLTKQQAVTLTKLDALFDGAAGSRDELDVTEDYAAYIELAERVREQLNEILKEAECKWCGNNTGCDCEERMQCTKAGEIGHMLCGVWPECGCPRFAHLGGIECLLTHGS